MVVIKDGHGGKDVLYGHDGMDERVLSDGHGKYIL
jgi:hypothetical protein